MADLATCSYRAYRSGYGLAVVTSLGLPRFRPEARDWPRCWLITPRSSYLRAEADEYTRCYLAQLDRFGPQKITQALEAIAREHDAQRLVLLCFEADPAQCHRQLFSRWLLERTGEVCPEITHK